MSSVIESLIDEKIEFSDIKNIVRSDFFNYYVNYEEIENNDSKWIKNSLINERFSQIPIGSPLISVSLNGKALHGIKLNYQNIPDDIILTHYFDGKKKSFSLNNSFVSKTSGPLVLFKKLYVPIESDSALKFESKTDDDYKVEVSSILIGPQF